MTAITELSRAQIRSQGLTDQPVTSRATAPRAKSTAPGASAAAAAAQISPTRGLKQPILPAPHLHGACRAERPEDTKLYSSDFSWHQTLPEIQAKFREIYNSNKRLPKRAYWNEEARRFELPHADSLGGPVILPQSYIDAVASHIETAFKKDYIDAVIFPDLGHSHLLIPHELWESKYRHIPVKKSNERYQAMFEDPELQTFYHTAEQLKMREEDGSLVSDPRTQHRYRTRNISGPHHRSNELQVHQNPNSKYNTVRDVPGYRWWGAGFNVSANKDGCFPYTVNGQTYYFDISLYDLAPGPGANIHSDHSSQEHRLELTDPDMREQVRQIFEERAKEGS